MEELEKEVDMEELEDNCLVCIIVKNVHIMAKLTMFGWICQQLHNSIISYIAGWL